MPCRIIPTDELENETIEVITRSAAGKPTVIEVVSANGVAYRKTITYDVNDDFESSSKWVRQ